MIIIDAIILHIPTTVLTFGSNGDINFHQFVTSYTSMRKYKWLASCKQNLPVSS